MEEPRAKTIRERLREERQRKREVRNLAESLQATAILAELNEAAMELAKIDPDAEVLDTVEKFFGQLEQVYKEFKTNPPETVIIIDRDKEGNVINVRFNGEMFDLSRTTNTPPSKRDYTEYSVKRLTNQVKKAIKEAT